MYTDEYLKEITIKVLQKLEQKYNFSEAEVYIQSVSQMMGGLEYRTPKVFQSVNRVGCAIRYFKENQLFFACFPLNSILSELDNLESITTYPIASPKFEFPEIKLTSSSVSNIYDKRIASLNEEEIYSISYSMSEEEGKIKDIILDGSILLSLERKVIANSSQSVAFEKSTWFDIDLRALYRGFDMISSSEKHLTSRQIPSSVSSIVEDMVNETMQRSTPGEQLENLSVPAVFSPMAFSQIFSFAFIPLLNQISSERLDRTDISPDFNLIDDGTVPGLPNSTAFDDEGTAQSKTIVVRNGIFHTALNNSQNIQEKEERTGNSFRVKMFEIFPRNYQAYPEIYPSNLLIGEGKESVETLIEDVKEGVYINSSQGYMTADSYSGTFKISAIDAYKIENGFVTGTLPTFDVIGNMFDLLSEDPQFSKDRKVVRPTNTPYSILSPYVYTDNVEIFL
ncbi:MAG: TldD/PmbA family protein [Candidatus Heimdallarchaeota archaeon]